MPIEQLPINTGYTTLKKPPEDKIVVSGVNSKKEIEIDLGIINAVMEWFVSYAPHQLRTMHTVGRVIRFNDSMVELLKEEHKSSKAYIDRKADEVSGLPTDSDLRYHDSKPRMVFDPITREWGPQ